MDVTGKIPGESLGKVYACIYNAAGDQEGAFSASSFGSRSANGGVVSEYNYGDMCGHWSTTRVSNSQNILYCASLSRISNYGNTSWGLSAICVKDNTNPFIPKVDSNMIEYYPKHIVLENGQVWSTDYLNITTFRNGDSIPEANEDWLWEKYIRDKQPAWCYSSRGKSWGILYNYYAIIDPRGITPKGIRIPTYTEWENSVKFDIDKNTISKRNIPLWKIGTRDTDGRFSGNRPIDGLERKELGSYQGDDSIWLLDELSNSYLKLNSGKPIIGIYEY
jgi:hypothetical protein